MAIHKDLTGDEAIHQAAYVQSADPGAVGRDKLWVDTTAGLTVATGALVKLRNAANGAWVTLIEPALVPIIFNFSGGSTVIPAGTEIDCMVSFAGTIIETALLADQSGDLVVDLWADSYGNYPPTVADSICGAAKPTLAGAIKSQDTTLTGWTPAFAAGTTFRAHVDSAATITRAALVLTALRA